MYSFFILSVLSVWNLVEFGINNCYNLRICVCRVHKLWYYIVIVHNCLKVNPKTTIESIKSIECVEYVEYIELEFRYSCFVFIVVIVFKIEFYFDFIAHYCSNYHKANPTKIVVCIEFEFEFLAFIACNCHYCHSGDPSVVLGVSVSVLIILIILYLIIVLIEIGFRFGFGFTVQLIEIIETFKKDLKNKGTNTKQMSI